MKMIDEVYNLLAIADPAGNITAFALPVGDLRQSALRIMARYPDVEQVGFVYPPEGGSQGRWRLEMAGGEFCGNAARSFGLYVARETGLQGKTTVDVAISGSAQPVTVTVDTGSGEAEAAMPLPTKMGPLPPGIANYEVVFDGITHIIVEGEWADAPESTLKLRFSEIAAPYLGAKPPAFGVLFYDPDKHILRAAVCVPALETLVFERSCGSGSAALALYKAAGQPDGEYVPDGEFVFDVPQPGGVIRTRLLRAGGNITGLFIGGRVTLRKP